MTTDTRHPRIELDERSQTIFRRIVESYLSTGEPVGSRNLSRHLPMTLSPASVRNVMADLEALGLIYAPHTSAGRLPTETGLRLFVDGLLELGDLTQEERASIELKIGATRQARSVEEVLTEAGEMISGLSLCAGLVLTDKHVVRIKHIQFVPLEPTKALVVLVGDDGNVENRIADLPEGMPASVLTEASNYLNAHLRGLSFEEARLRIKLDLQAAKAELDTLCRRVIEAGLGPWSGDESERRNLIVRGTSHLLADVSVQEDIGRIRRLFDDLESKRDLIRILGSAEQGEGVRIFIGSESNLFSLSGSSLIVAPVADAQKKIVGVLGVIGPTRLNYGRIIPMVDYTARVVGKLIT
ncbi:MAG: heat-inducible transcriptional repressor HrcA [Rhizobiales bacterium]|nr:heat-inducible transcriptional repressor HrcA [Hyphomicrobiales bacterium]